MKKDIFDLNGKIALVTGASRGIGEAIATLFAAYGAHVIVSSRKIDDCNLVSEKIKADGGSAEALACHVGNMEDIARCFDYIKATHKKLDVLINLSLIHISEPTRPY